MCFSVKKRRQDCAKELTSLRCWTYNSEFQKENEKSKKLTAELSSINDKVSNKEGVVRNQQEFVGKERKALQDAWCKVRKPEDRLERQQQKLEKEQQALELVL